ncbi:hypothetical protein GCM10010191_36350 [Actinomadura vinacea]|uniref:DUF8129 domain-containing protein n=1 Tax=Actinomadura vinacea TaxID=115336 RepID=A0ABP5W903_9ACTN
MTKSPRRLKQQVQETVGEQVRDLPLHAVRLAMFGVGRALLLSDRVTRDYKEITEGGGVRPVIGRLRDDVQHTAEKVVGQVVERVRGDGTVPEPKPEPEPAKPEAAPRDEISVGKPKPEPEAEEKLEPRPESKPAAPAEAERVAAGLPVPNYDEATLPQLRARLRGLSSEQVKLLREYERKHAARPDVLKMYENRIAKLNGLN